MELVSLQPRRMHECLTNITSCQTAKSSENLHYRGAPLLVSYHCSITGICDLTHLHYYSSRNN